MLFLAVFLFFIAFLNVVATGFTSAPSNILSIIMCIGGIKCLISVKEKRKKFSRTDSASGTYVKGDIIDLGNGQSFDSHNPDNVIGINWKSDGRGGYYNSATGEEIIYNNGGYHYRD